MKLLNGKFFITTPIFYANASPHLGHLYTALIADAQARFQQMKWKSSVLVTGTDEHGIKVQQVAGKKRSRSGILCEPGFKSLCQCIQNV